MRKFVYVLEMLIVRHLGTPNSSFPVASICFTVCDLGLFISVNVFHINKTPAEAFTPPADEK